MGHRGFKRSWRFVLVLLFSSCLLSACSKNNVDDKIIFETGTTDEYMYIIWEDKTYVPFCGGILKSQMGSLLGHIKNNEEDKIYELKGYSSSEWLVSFLDTKIMSSSMLFKEINVENIPDNLESDYEWNK